jgi:peptide-methionine (R)-S-oxide reductase
MAEKIKKTDAEWRKELTPEQYYVMRQKGTEPPFTGKYVDAKEQGTYVCAACGQPLFESKTKFESGTGWPSFTAPLASGSVEEERDASHGMIRAEAKCARCEAHLGHVFDDGPRDAGGMRYCINSASLKLDSAKPNKK